MNDQASSDCNRHRTSEPKHHAADPSKPDVSHACWLITYPLAGWLGATAGLTSTFVALGLVAIGAVAAARLWAAQDPDEIEHVHHALADGHPHLAGATRVGSGHRHTHVFVIDSHHPDWPAER